MAAVSNEDISVAFAHDQLNLMVMMLGSKEAHVRVVWLKLKLLNELLMDTYFDANFWQQ